MIRLLTATLLFAASPALAGHDEGMKGEHKHPAESAAAAKPAPAASDPEFQKAVAEGGEFIVVDMLGVVCDFCAKALDKTFSKEDAVAKTAVDLDTRTLAIATKPGATLDDAAIKKLASKAGYKVAAIRRGEAALGPAAEQAAGDAQGAH